MAVNASKRIRSGDELRSRTPQESQVETFCRPADQRPCVTMCTPTADRTCACEEVRQALEAEISVQGLKLSVGAMKTACDGVCRYGPLVGFPQRGFFYRQVSPERAREVVAETLAKGHILFDLLHCDPLKATSGRILYDRHCGFITTIDDSFCMVQVARYFLEFDRGVSCGKCVPCRIGSVQLRETLDRIIRGQGRPEDLELTERICNAMRDAAYCDFGKTSSAPVSLILKYFRSEFESHIDQRLCPAGVCPGLTGTREEE